MTRGFGGVKRWFNSCPVNLTIERLDSKARYDVVANTAPSLCDPIPAVPWPNIKGRWKHLADLPLVESKSRIDILLGLDHAELMSATESRTGGAGEPVAMNTALGWIARGVIGGGGNRSRTRMNLSITTGDEDLAAQFRRFCDTESFGTEGRVPGKMAPEDELAKQIVESGTRKLEVGYEVPLPWRQGEPNLPCNRPLAELRLQALLRRFEKDPSYKADYEKAMDKYQSAGYAHEVTDENELGIEQQIVFDSSAMYEGRSLNSALLTGPALQNELRLVLLKFSEGSIAFAADVEAMFSRIRLHPEDARYHRFLWKDPESERVKHNHAYCSRVWPGSGRGGTSVRAIQNNLYMDDYLDSARTTSEAIARARDVQDILRKGDFHLTKWVSNCKELMEAFGGDSSSLTTAEEYHLGEDTFDTKVLGVRWRQQDDVLVFHVDLGEAVFTRRGLLSKMAKIYDPLGLLSPAVTRAKIMHRQLGLCGLNWDDDIPAGQKKWWKRWIGQLEELKSLSVPRCLFPREGEIASSELHTFGDASEEAFAAAMYLRNVYKDGDVTVRIVMAKARLAPLKTVSVARLELQAALLGARLTTNWIRSPAAYYKPYVNHRIGEIQTLTDPSEWRFVPGRLNISDCATRSTAKQRELIHTSWFRGPEISWPVDLPWIVNNEERRTVRGGQVLHVTEEQPADWSYVDDLAAEEFAGSKGKFLKGGRRLAGREDAEEDVDPSVIRTIRRRAGAHARWRKVGKSPPALRQSPPDPVTCSPPVVEKDDGGVSQSPKAFRYGQCAVCYIRQYFWILRGRQLVKKVRKSCLQCAKEFTKTGEQLMAELPIERLAVGCPPFHRTSVDYFGPILVKSERNRCVKRYGVIFTCLTIRAVYLDIAQSLSTEDFLLVLRRFVSLYGKPESVYPDNGRNFVGVARELRRAVQTLNGDDALKKYTASEGIRWKFQPANAPHFGGIHESSVKSAKRALCRMLASGTPDSPRVTEEVFRTLLFEAPGLLNSRPITYASSDPKDYRPLTPNDFMNRPSFVHVPVGTFTHASMRQRYQEVERLSTLFWDLWKSHYLPTLIQRTKWKVQRRNLSIGDCVLLAEPNVPKGQWITGRVEAVFPGSDGLGRVVKVATKNGSHIRPIHRLCSLQESNSPGSLGTCSGGAGMVGR
ncbi:Pao retrotransposon peptidase [Trichuris suis]|nr:Pao retrotransposon peptidase [Trichuris suis]